MIFKPRTGAMWDPSILWHNGKYHAFMMYNKDGDNGLGAGHCLLATSADGVHWKDEGGVINEGVRPDGAAFFKCFVAKCGDRFIMDHGVARQQGQDVMRFHQSKDLRFWDHIASSEPDARWYSRERWDHMYILPKVDGKPEAGYWGYIVAVSKEPNQLPAMMESRDGITWEAMPPARTSWGATPKRAYLEYGGCERIGGKHYLIGGVHEYMGNKGYAMYTFVADHPRGPFRPDAEAFRLCGNSGKFVAWLAAWARGKDELLISNYASPHPYDRAPWLLPLRKPVVDKNGHLRMAWWKGNETLKGRPLATGRKKIILDGKGKPGSYDVFCLARIRSAAGVILEGVLQARALACGDNEPRPAVGFVIQGQAGQAMAVQMGIGAPDGRETHIGPLSIRPDGTHMFSSEDVTGKGCATVTGVEDGRRHTFRLLRRMGLFELYIDDMLMQTYTCEPDSDPVGLLVCNARAEFSNLRAWTMDARQTASIPDSLDPHCSALEAALSGLPPAEELETSLRAGLPDSATANRATKILGDLVLLQKNLPGACRRAAKELASSPNTPKATRVRELLRRIEELHLTGAAYAKRLAHLAREMPNEPSRHTLVSEFKSSPLRAPVADIASARPPRPGLARNPVPFFTEFELADIRAVHGGADGVIYVEATVKLDRAYHGALAYGADGPVKVWVNNRAVDSQPQATNPALAGQYTAPVPWKKGVNRISFALASNHGKAWGVQARVLRSRPTSTAV
jgi:hypothetical protein